MLRWVWTDDKGKVTRGQLMGFRVNPRNGSGVADWPLRPATPEEQAALRSLFRQHKGKVEFIEDP